MSHDGGHQTNRTRDGGRKLTSKSVKSDATTKGEESPASRALGDDNLSDCPEEPTPKNCSAKLSSCRKQGDACGLTPTDILPEILDFCRDQHGSKFVQARFEDASKADKQAMFDAILPEASKLSCDA